MTQHQNPALQAVVFDMDGLMVNSEPLSHQAWNSIVEPFGHHIDDALYASFVGRGGLETAEYVCELFSLPIPPERLNREAGEVWFELCKAGVPMMPGIDDMHAKLRAARIPWSVATASPRYMAELIVSQLRYHEDCVGIATASDVPNAKPAPDVYLLGADLVGTPPSACLAMDDSVPGCQSAMAAGMWTIAIPGPHSPLSAYEFTHEVHHSLYDILPLIDQYFV